MEGSVHPAVEEASETAKVQLEAEPSVPVADLVEVTAETSSNGPAAVEEAAEVEHESEFPAPVTVNDQVEVQYFMFCCIIDFDLFSPGNCFYSFGIDS